jgi:hypothetical protein
MHIYSLKSVMKYRIKEGKHICIIHVWDVEYVARDNVNEIIFEYMPLASNEECRLFLKSKTNGITLVNSYPAGTTAKDCQNAIQAAFSSVGVDYRI